jgi:hypothetical protein
MTFCTTVATIANAPSPTPSVAIMLSVNSGARIRRRTACSVSRPQLPLRRHLTAGRIRSPSPLRAESANA